MLRIAIAFLSFFGFSFSFHCFCLALCFERLHEGWHGYVVVHDTYLLVSTQNFLSHLNLLYLYIFRSIVLFVTQVWCTFISQLQHTTDILDFIALCFYIQTHPRLFITGEP